MSRPRIDVLVRGDRDTPSVRIILQTLSHLDERWDVHLKPIRRPDLTGRNILVSAIELSILSARTLLTAFRLRTKPDILLINKTLPREPLGWITRIPIPEHLFVGFHTTVYSTMDADYVWNPRAASLLFEKADLIYATSRAIYDEATEYASEDRVVLLPPSVDTDFFTPDVDVPERLDDENLVIGWIGGADNHGETLRHLVRCLEDVPPAGITVRLLLGGGSLPDGVEEGLRKAGFEVDVIEYVPWESVPAVTNSIDVGLVPLRDTPFDRGKSSQKVREYMACGIPVVASNVGENRHIVPEDGGILVDDPAGWGEAVQTLRDDEELRQTMGENARAYVEETCAIPVVAAALEAEFERLVDRETDS